MRWPPPLPRIECSTRPAAIAAGARCDRSVVWVLNQRLARKLAVGASAAGLFDQLGASKRM